MTFYFFYFTKKKKTCNLPLPKFGVTIPQHIIYINMYKYKKAFLDDIIIYSCFRTLVKKKCPIAHWNVLFEKAIR